MELDNTCWKDSDINVDSLWLIQERDKTGKHTNAYHGNFIPQIPYQLLKRYTKENDIVLDLFMGSGTTLFECETLSRRFIGFDINEEIIKTVEKKMQESTIPFVIKKCDVTNPESFELNLKESFDLLQGDGLDFFIAHPPYMDIIKFTNLQEDLSQILELPVFLERCSLSIKNAFKHLKNNKYFAVIMGDVYKNSEVIPLSFYIMYSIKKSMNVKLKGIIIKNIAGNRGKLGCQNIWKYRALKSDYYLFKHEYIFVFKKIK